MCHYLSRKQGRFGVRPSEQRAKSAMAIIAACLLMASRRPIAEKAKKFMMLSLSESKVNFDYLNT